MTEIEQNFKRQHNLEKWDKMFKTIMDYKKSCEHTLFPSDFEDELKFMFKEKERLKIKQIEIYWWTHKAFLSKPIHLIHYILVEWQDGKVAKLYCFNSVQLDEFQLTKSFQNYIMKNGGTLHKSMED